jgi:hypothetical protein
MLTIRTIAEVNNGTCSIYYMILVLEAQVESPAKKNLLLGIVSIRPTFCARYP